MELRKITIGQLLKERVRLTPDAACIGDSHKSCSWKETADSAEKLALLYMQLGLKKGDHAAVWGVNSTDWVITYLALARLGVISVLVNISLTISELEVLVNILFTVTEKMALSFLCFRKWKEIKRPV